MKRVFIVLSLMLCLAFSATAAKADSFDTVLFGGLITLPATSLEVGMNNAFGSNNVSLTLPSTGFYDVSLAYVSNTIALASNLVPPLVDGWLDTVNSQLPAFLQGNGLFAAISELVAGIPGAISSANTDTFTVSNVPVSAVLFNMFAEFINNLNIELEVLGFGIDPAIAGYQYTGIDEVEYEWNGSTLLVTPDSVFVGLNIFALNGLEQNLDIVFAFTKASINAVPVPGAIFLLAPGIAGIAALRRKMA